MKKSGSFFLAATLFFLSTVSVYAQVNTVTGNVKSSQNSEVLSGVSVLIKATSSGTFTDDKGHFKITTSTAFPITLVFSSIGYETKEVEITASGAIEVVLDPAADIGQEIVFSASRLPERILESTVTIERVNSATIRNMAVPNYYEGIVYLKGVDMTTSSMGFRTLSTRGFNGSGNLKFNQFVDGIDNQAPGLNFSVGNVIGMTELDVDNIELLPGASSALYGSGGMNGTLLMTSKNPFKHQGLSIQIKQGVMHVDEKYRSIAPYFDWAARWAKSFNDKFAFKISAQYIKGEDWQARDNTNLSRNSVFSSVKDGDRNSDPNYDGVNVYGDEVSYNIKTLASIIVKSAQDQFVAAYQQSYNSTPSPAVIDAFLSDPANGVAAFYAGLNNNLIPSQNVSRTGYEEQHIVDYSNYNLKFNGGLYYNLTSNIEASLVGYWGTGTTVYTGADRYSLRRLKIGQYKAELKSRNWLIRAYTTQENAGESSNSTALASYINEAWKPSLNTASAQTIAGSWFPQYIGAYLQAVMNSQANPHAIARQFADQGRFLPESPEFKEAYETLRKTPISERGALFLDKTDLWQVDGQLNLTDQVKFAEVLIGGNFRKYLLKSEGTLFNDDEGRITINEFGAFVQAQKKFFEEGLKLTASVRFDKSKNFDGRFTPRFSALVKLAKDHNVRMSFQSAYRFPSTQDQYIDLFTGTSTLIGGLPDFQSKYNLTSNPAYTAESIVAFRETGNSAVLRQAQYRPLEAETAQSWEVGYKGVFNSRFLVDVYAYYTQYKNFIGRVAVVQPAAPGPDGIAGLAIPAAPYSNNFSYPQNSDSDVKSLGFGISAEYRFGKGYVFSGNMASDRLNNVEANLVTFFNAPKYRFALSMGNQDVYKGLGFNLSYRWQDEVYWEGTFGTGMIPSYGTMDAQVSYRIPAAKVLLKLGGSNILNKYYTSAFGNPAVGGLYYVSVGWNVF